MVIERIEGPKRWPTLERPWVAWPLRLLALALGLGLVLVWTGRLPLSRRLHVAAIVGLLVSLTLGWRVFRERLAAIQSTVLLALVYVLGVGSVTLVMRLTRHDLLDLKGPKPSLWRRRDPVSPDELDRDLERQF